MRKRHLRRAVRNFAVTALLLLLLWIAEDCPLPMEADMHRKERQSLTEQSEIVWRRDARRSGDRDMLVGLTARAVHTYAEGGRFYIWPRREEGCTLVMLPENTRHFVQGGDYLDPSLVVADPPPRAESARLTITLNVNDWTEDYVIEGQKQDGVFFFQTAKKYRHPPAGEGELTDEAYEEWARLWGNPEDTAFHLLEWSGPDDFNLPYTLEFYDHSGALVASVRDEGFWA